MSQYLNFPQSWRLRNANYMEGGISISSKGFPTQELAVLMGVQPKSSWLNILYSRGLILLN